MSAGGIASSTATKPALFSTVLSATTRISSSPQPAVKLSSSKPRAMTVTTATAVSNCSSVVNGQIWRAQSTATIWCLTKMIPDLTARIRLGVYGIDEEVVRSSSKLTLASMLMYKRDENHQTFWNSRGMTTMCVSSNPPISVSEKIAQIKTWSNQYMEEIALLKMKNHDFFFVVL